MRKPIRKEDMVQGPYNPDRKLSFVDSIVLELIKRKDRGMISPLIYSQAIDLARRLSKQLTNIYGGSRHGLSQAVETVLRITRNHLP